jgi:release factor glutamine methyltransferase
MMIKDALPQLLNRLDTEVLLSHLLKRERTWILAHTDYVLRPEEEVIWKEWMARRMRYEPVAYIIGEKEFYGRIFSVNPSVLIPRPATEILVEAAMNIVHKEKVAPTLYADTEIVIVSNIWGDVSTLRSIVDIGTGSGCIAITLACELSDMHIIATDISGAALQIARKNAEHYGVLNRIGYGADPLTHITEPFLIVTNPPYIPEGMQLMQDVEDFEPEEALFAGGDGAELIRAIIKSAHDHPLCIGLVMECREEQAILAKS